MFSDASVYRMLDFLVIGFYLGVVVVLLVTVLVLLLELLNLKIQRLKYEIAEQEEDVQEEDASPEDCKEEDLNLAEGIQKGDYRDDGAFTMVVLEKSDSELYEIFTMKNDRGLSDSDFENFKRLYDFIVEQQRKIVKR